MEAVELDRRVALHALWLAGDPTGIRLELPGEELSGAQLAGIDLRKCDLTKANLARANLSAADLTSSVLRGTSFREADLRGAILDGAITITADFTGALTDRLVDTAARDDLFALLDAAPSEVKGLREALLAGRLSPGAMNYLRAAIIPPADRWFNQIRRGDGPENPAVKIALTWLDEWEAL